MPHQSHHAVTWRHHISVKINRYDEKNKKTDTQRHLWRDKGPSNWNEQLIAFQVHLNKQVGRVVLRLYRSWNTPMISSVLWCCCPEPSLCVECSQSEISLSCPNSILDIIAHFFHFSSPQWLKCRFCILALSVTWQANKEANLLWRRWGDVWMMVWGWGRGWGGRFGDLPVVAVEVQRGESG